MKQPLIAICLLILLCSAAAAQQMATTIDGRKVLLNDDGTWKYADAKGLTLKIEVGIAYTTGPVPVARTTFTLLKADPRPALRQLPHTPSGISGLGQISLNCRFNNFPEATAIIKQFAITTLVTGFDGRATLEDIKPGEYWLYGTTKAFTNSCVTWLMPVDLTKNQNLILDQNNAFSVME